MIKEQSLLTRKAKIHITDSGTPFAHSVNTHKNFHVNAEFQPPLQLPGLVIFVYGVNSEGEWYNNAEKSLCEGLNQRSGLNGQHVLVENQYVNDYWKPCDKNNFKK